LPAVPAPDPPIAEIRAAGGVVLHDGRVAVVHRPRHEDWSLPKGKLDPGESWEQAALREVHEECGLRCALLDELPPSAYAVAGRPKRVRWWTMRVLADDGFSPSEEVDELRWLAPAAAIELLTYADDRALVAHVA
jgi:8-oxo-dGTP diphosphatase